LCKKPSDLKKLFGKVKENPYISKNCPYGDGYSSKKIIEVLKNEKF
jgi:UDP-N-acetylglucosamine 2-epimerase